jgi:hypothetical protein
MAYSTSSKSWRGILDLTSPYEYAKHAFGADSVQVVSTVAQQAGTVATPTER